MRIYPENQTIDINRQETNTLNSSPSLLLKVLPLTAFPFSRRFLFLQQKMAAMITEALLPN